MDTDLRGPAARAQTRRLELTRIALERAGPGLLVNGLLAVAALALLWPVLSPRLLLPWAGLLVAASLAGYLLLRRRRAPDPARLGRWRGGFYLAGFLLGAAWAIPGFEIMAAPPSGARPAFLLLLSLLASGSAYVLAPVTIALTALLAAVAAPIAVAAAAAGAGYGGVEATLFVGVCLLAAGTSRKLRDTLAATTDLRTENEHLVAIINLLHAAAEPPAAGGTPACGPDAASDPAPAAQVRAALDAAGDGIVIAEPDGTVRYLNPAAETLTGWSRREAGGKPAAEVLALIDERSRRKLPDPVARCARLEAPVTLEPDTLLLHRDRTRESVVSGTFTPVAGTAGEAVSVVAALQDVTELAGLDRLISFQRIHDPLTGLLNRRELEARLRRVVETDRRDGRAHALLSLGIDQFWEVHDTCGYAASDSLLRQVAALLPPALRGTDAAARLRADDFAVLLLDCDLDHARAVAEGLREAIQGIRFTWETHPFEITVSVGVMEVGVAGETTGELMHAANAARSLAKDLGRNRVHVYQSDDAALLRQQDLAQWHQQVQQAVDEDRFRLFVQEIAPSGARGNGTRHGELLVRMTDDRGTLVAPQSFLEAAERYNLMPAIDRWVIHHALAAIKRRPRTLAHLGTCAVNISGQSLSDRGFLDQVLDELDAVSLEPERICFEITESAVIEHLDHAQRFITTLRRRGHRFSLDDFGTGLSSFAYLKNLPVDFIKIDGGFVSGMSENESDRAMVESFNQVGHVLGLATVAEFVENEATLNLLRQIGVDYVQGSLIGLPEPID